MTEKFEVKIMKFAKKHNLSYRFQDLKFGFRRIVFDTCSYEEHEYLSYLLGRIKGIDVSQWQCNAGGVFEGYLYVMDNTDHETLTRELEREVKESYDWWHRYTNANKETQRLMACGKIA